jgi:DNA (cytosine-5)-methyltransferase 1
MTADRLQPNRPAQPRMVDLFAGPGGLDVAARWLGIEVHGIEWDPNACATRTKAGLATTPGDVRDFGPENFPHATILTGGPPCQTYTVAGGGAGRRALDQVRDFVKRMAAAENDVDRKRIADELDTLDDERTGLVLEPLRWALAADRLDRPYQTIVLEQVPAVLPVWESMKEALAGIGYRTTCGILRTEEYGVPQTRRRAILIARRDVEPVLPERTHQRFPKDPAPIRRREVMTSGEQALFQHPSRQLTQWVSMGAALRRTRDVPFTVISNYGTGGDPKARGRRSSDQPSATVTGKVSRNRLVDERERDLDRFTHAEAGLLQTFPLDYPWSGGDVSQQIGNAIPPRLAVHVLAAALGITVDGKALDKAVNGRWAKTRDSHPLMPAESGAREHW